MPSPFADLLAELAQALRALRVPWFLFGAQAAILYGVERLTNDVDVTIDLGELPASTLVGSLERAGFVLRVRDVENFIRRTRVLPMRHRKSGIDLDIVLAGPGPEEGFLARARQKRIEGVRIPVAGPEDIVVMKVLAGRPKDLEDVVDLLAAQRRTIRITEIRRSLRELEAALDQSDLIPILDRALLRLRRAKALENKGSKKSRRRR